MITNKDLSIDSENGKIILNGDKYDLGTQGEIDTAVKDIYSVMGQLGAKNLIPYPYTSNSYSQKGIDFTCLSDGTINANGTNDGTGNSTYFFVNFTLSKGTYVLNGCPTQTGSNYRCGVARASDSGTIASEQGSGAKFTLDADIQVRFYVQVFSGKTADNITFKPMLRFATDTDDTYEPYAMTNKQLTEQVATKQDTLTFDNIPTANSINPVKSDGIKTYVDGKIFVKGLTLGTSLVVNANSFGRAEIPCSESGYTPLGVISVQGAALAGAVTIMEFGLSADETKVYVYFANNTNTNLTLPDVRIRVLYTKN